MPLPDDDIAEFESHLRAMRPRGCASGLASRVIAEAEDEARVEDRLRAMRPVGPGVGFASRVVAASTARDNIVRFPVLRSLAGIAAAVALVFLIVPSGKDQSVSSAPAVAAVTPKPASVPAAITRPVVAAPIRVAPEIASDALFAVADDGSVLPVINLGDGTPLRAVVRPALSSQRSGILPVSAPAAPLRVEYVPVDYN